MGSLTASAPPIIDFGPFYGNDTVLKQRLTDQIRDACLEKGFFQIINHDVSATIQRAVLAQSKAFFDLPLEQKLRYDKTSNPHNRGYESLRGQNFEKKGDGDLKEGYYFGIDLPTGHPAVGKFNMGPNTYPETVPDAALFKHTIDSYFAAVSNLAHDILKVLALTLSLPETHFADFCIDPIATLRLLHYPPQDATANPDERGCGAHTDFGAITLLLQDEAGGLQVYDHGTNSWIDVQPTPNAFVINLGNMMMRWSNDRYVSNLHRVINKSGKERYSIPFFFSGNPDFTVKCLPGCEGETGAKYAPVKVEDWIKGRYADTYGGKKEDAVGDMVSERR